MPARSMFLVILLLVCGLPAQAAVPTDPGLAPGGLAGFYYATPDFSGPAQMVVDGQVDFDWGTGAPLPGMPVDDFTVRWLGQVLATDSEDLTLVVRSDDGVRVWLDGVLVINDWVARAPSESRYTFPALAGHAYALRLDYFEAKGGAVASLAWESAHHSRQAIPSANLIPLLQPSLIAIPAASPVSPICLVGMRRPDAQVQVSADGTVRKVKDLPETGFYADVPLDAQRATSITVDGQVAEVAWTPSEVTGDHHVVIRVGDALLLTAARAVVYDLITDSGVVATGRKLKAGATRVERFAAAGQYAVLVSDATGASAGRMDIEVVGVNFDGPVACQVGFRREKGVEISGAPADRVEFAGADASLLDVAFKEVTDYGVRIYLTALRRGAPLAVARLAGGGAIIGTQRIDEFTLSTDALLAAVRNDDNGSAGVAMTLRPWLPDLTAQFRIFAHATTFEGGGKALDISSNDVKTFIDPATGEKCGLFEFQLAIPDGESLYCFNLAIDQHSNHGTTVGGSTFNGAACDFTVDKLSIEQGDVTAHQLVINEGASNADANHHGKHKKDHPILLDTRAAGSLVMTPDPVNGATFDCVKEDNWRPIITGTAKAKTGLYSVAIHNTLFKDCIEVYSNCKFELSATIEKAGKDKLFRVFPGTSVTINCKLLKKGTNDPATHTLFVTGTTSMPFEITCPKKEGETVTQKVDVFALKLPAGDYSARILSSSKEKIFTVTDRQTLNNMIDTLHGEMGHVTTGGAAVTPGAATIVSGGTTGAFTVTITQPFNVTYEAASDLQNFLNPGQSMAWSPAEMAKAPAGELTNWGLTVDYVQNHETGHVATWDAEKVANRVETAHGSGTGTTAAEARTAANAALALEITAIGAIPAQIKTADNEAQAAFHLTPRGGVDVGQFKIPGRD